MASSLDTAPTAKTFDLETLVALARTGEIRIPHFQRDFRWGWEDVRRLFDSIDRGYPIGSLLLWIRSAPRTTIRLGALEIDAPAFDRALWVVDGQQRLTSLASALDDGGHNHPTFALSYDLEQRLFVRPGKTTAPSVVPLPVLFDLQRLLSWFATNPQLTEHLDTATSVAKKIRQFSVPAYQVSQEDVSVLQDIFDRMNNYGKRLSRAEIFSALNAGQETTTENRPTFDRLAAQLDEARDFGVIDNDTVLLAVLARRGPDVRRDIRIEFNRDNSEGRDAAYQHGYEALERAVTFLQEEAGVPHVAFLAYRYLLVTLARLFAHHPFPDPRSLRLLRRWYWRDAVAGPERFKGGTAVAARTLCARIKPGSLNESVQGLLDTIGNRPAPPDIQRFSTNEATTKMVLCSWWAREPRSPESGDRFEHTELAEALTDQFTAREAVRYLVHRSSAPESLRTSSANRLLVPKLVSDSAELSGMFSRRPADLSDQEWSNVLQSHNLTTDLARLLSEAQMSELLSRRRSIVDQQFVQFIDQMCEWDFEDTPPLASLAVDEEPDDMA